ncbi:hypothetical protein BV898_01596 [Hypsibius exemplaris]|uniref:Cadherin domain-containing protein n=1 Tax=Hypsibius exemplaris TaxID=2072580 RepID=A0A1W0XAI3_HYPEX|nr:hypothetical protein BV898_01596 [Hypsibius exemplaris]
MQESVGVRAVSADGSAVVQGSLSVVVFVAPSYLRICNSQPIPTTMPSTVKQLTIPPPTTASTAVNGGQNGVAVTFIGDSSFTTTKCDGQSAGAPTQVAATIRARFTPNIDFSKLRITVSNSLFKPALPVVCDETFICDISIVFAQPLDSSFAGNYAPYIQLEGGGLSKIVQNLQVHVNCNDLMADAVPLPPRRGVVDPSKIVPELPPCGVANVSVDVSEDMPVGTVVTSLPLNNGNPGFRYQILDSSAVGFFDLIEPASVAVSSPLFQPTVDSVYLRVVGMLGNATVCATDVFIGVKNVNRNRPVFDQSSYNFAIDCLLPMSIVGTVSASDIDAGRNNIRRFFVAPEDTPLVLVDPASGGIHLRQTLTDSTSFTIFVEDPGTNMRSSAVVQISCTGNNQVSGMLGAGSSGLGRSFQTTTTKAPVVLKSDPRKHPVVTSNKPSSFPFAVVFSGSSKASTSTSRSARSPPLT